MAEMADFCFFIELDNRLLNLTWKAEPLDVHANFYTELMYPLLKDTIIKK